MSETNVERLQKAGLLAMDTKKDKEQLDRINNDLSAGDIEALIRIASKLGMEDWKVLEHIMLPHSGF